MEDFFKKIKSILKADSNKEEDSLNAYELWADNYDSESGNLMLHFDRILFDEFLSKVNLNKKIILDFGCGTGRYWKTLLDRNPVKIIGCDISVSMINKLKAKFPNAETYILKNNQLDFLCDNSIDIIISTLVVAHIKNIEEVIKEWNIVLKKSGEIFITDFHPYALKKGAKRTFNKNGKKITIKNHIHPIEKLEKIFLSFGFKYINKNEKIIDENVKEFYEKQNALKIYEEFKNVPMIYSLHFKK
ncbi:MAG: class I SAM-dependent methyltransferase [Ignavibacteriaceae bacterium]